MKNKRFWETLVGKITERLILIVIGKIAKNQKPIKGNAENEKIVDDILE
jgi:hypothetical protein